MAALEDSAFGRLIGALVSPVKTFRSIAARPTWGAALIVLIVTTATVGLLANQRLDKDEMRHKVQERIEKSQGGQASPEDVDRAMRITETANSVGRWLVPVFVAVVYLIVAALFLGAFRFFGGSDLSFKQSFAVTLHSFMPAVISALLALPLILSRERIGMQEAQNGVLASNLAAFAPDDLGNAARTLLGSFDFFSIWTVCLLILGYRTVARVSTTAAVATVVILWILYIGVRVGLASLG